MQRMKTNQSENRTGSFRILFTATQSCSSRSHGRGYSFINRNLFHVNQFVCVFLIGKTKHDDVKLSGLLVSKRSHIRQTLVLNLNI
jgi:hypothetical protein